MIGLLEVVFPAALVGFVAPVAFPPAFAFDKLAATELELAAGLVELAAAGLVELAAAGLVELAAAAAEVVVAFPAGLVELAAAATAEVVVVAFPAGLVELAAAAEVVVAFPAGLVELAANTCIGPIIEDVANVITRANTRTMPKTFETIF